MKIAVKPLSELVQYGEIPNGSTGELQITIDLCVTPTSSGNMVPRKAQNTVRRKKLKDGNNPTVESKTSDIANAKITKGKSKRKLRADLSPNQKRIDSYFKVCAKKFGTIDSNEEFISRRNGKKPGLRRILSTSTESESVKMQKSETNKFQHINEAKTNNVLVVQSNNRSVITTDASTILTECVNLCSDSEVESTSSNTSDKRNELHKKARAQRIILKKPKLDSKTKKARNNNKSNATNNSGSLQVISESHEYEMTTDDQRNVSSSPSTTIAIKETTSPQKLQDNSVLTTVVIDSDDISCKVDLDTVRTPVKEKTVNIMQTVSPGKRKIPLNNSTQSNMTSELTKADEMLSSESKKSRSLSSAIPIVDMVTKNSIGASRGAKKKESKGSQPQNGDGLKRQVLIDKPPVGKRQRKPRPCPTYKVVDETTFAVDAFQFGRIEGVTHYFLTHYHADHYVGLTRKFDMPLYLSPITARLVRAFIPIDEQYLHEMVLGESVVINDVEVIAIDANHCPGAIMIFFKLPNGRCILHTGDFRANGDMESEPLFWNHNIDTIYLDTTYISNKYNFCQQTESIDQAIDVTNKFRDKHSGKRVLCVCGGYFIGKERFWSAIARQFKWRVWADSSRRRALNIMQLEELDGLLCDDPVVADLHVIPIGKLNYQALSQYFQPLAKYYDVLLAFRPSGWEKNSRPQYRGEINIVGIEYSEHSSYNELRRFVSYLKPLQVISTVPVSKDLNVTAKIPLNWFNYAKLEPRSNYQPSIRTYLSNKSVSAAFAAKSQKEKWRKNAIKMANAVSSPMNSKSSPSIKSTLVAVAGSTCNSPNTSNHANQCLYQDENNPCLERPVNNRNITTVKKPVIKLENEVVQKSPTKISAYQNENIPLVEIPNNNFCTNLEDNRLKSENEELQSSPPKITASLDADATDDWLS